MKPRARARQAGFTLIELMVALLVSTLLVGMILAIFARVSLAYRSQQQVAGLQQVLASARAVLEVDAKQAGLGISQGYKVAFDGATMMHSPIEITNSSTGPDALTIAYGDPSVQGAVTASAWPVSLTVDSAAGFKPTDLVVLSTPSFTTQSPIAPGVDANIATFDACVVQIQSIAGNVLTFSQAAPWGEGGNTHCNNPGTYLPSFNTSGNGTMVYKFVAHRYRISTTTPMDGQLEMSPTGNLSQGSGSGSDFTPLGFGFTDIQVALELYDNDAIDEDGNLDAARDFYSSTLMQTDTAPIPKVAPNAFLPPIQMTITLVARTDRDVEGITTASTPTLTNGSAANNSVGDRGPVALPPAAVTASCDANCVTALQGNRIYRYTTFTVDLRNMGVGR